MRVLCAYYGQVGFVSQILYLYSSVFQGMCGGCGEHATSGQLCALTAL